jgi:hypothetical protein
VTFFKKTLSGILVSLHNRIFLMKSIEDLQSSPVSSPMTFAILQSTLAIATVDSPPRGHSEDCLMAVFSA